MNAYNEIDGVPCAASRWLLTEVLRERWGFDGIVVADYFAVRMLHQLHRVAAGPVELRRRRSAPVSTSSCPPPSASRRPRRGPRPRPRRAGGARRGGAAGCCALKLALRRLRVAVRRRGRARARDDAPEARALAREVAARSIVLLANDGVLPLAPGARVAVLGPNADDPMALFGNYSFQNHVASHFPDHPIERAPTVLDALRERMEHVSPRPRLPHPARPGQSTDDRSGIPAAAEAPAPPTSRSWSSATRPATSAPARWGRAPTRRTCRCPVCSRARGGRARDRHAGGAGPGERPPLRPLGVAERCAAWSRPGSRARTAPPRSPTCSSGDVAPSGRTTVGFARGAGAMPRHHDHKALAAGIPPLPGLRAALPVRARPRLHELRVHGPRHRARRGAHRRRRQIACVSATPAPATATRWYSSTCATRSRA
jgi:hypothetical protein